MILIVDDHPEACLVLQRLLERSGYPTQSVTTGAAAIEFTHTVLPDLIILDANMPGMDGLEVLRRLKQYNQTKSIPVLF